MQQTSRIASIDFFRGFTMFLLIGESTYLFGFLNEIPNSFFHFIATQLHHHHWHGLHFWDLIQPFFMFIVGVSIPFAVNNRLKSGESSNKITKHALKRSLLLLLLGWMLYSCNSDKILFKFQNVLAQLSVTYLIAFLLRNKKNWIQIVFTLFILLFTDLAYRFFPVEGFNHPWEPYHNIGAYMNNMIEGVDKTDIWASINAFPTIAHTVWGVLCGKLLMSENSNKNKVIILTVSGITCLLIGYILDWGGVNPIIKRIATSSFVLVSGGWAILALCFFYWIIDLKGWFSKWLIFFKVVGMNCIFIYLVFELGGASIIYNVYKPFVNTLLVWSGELTAHIMTSLATWMSLWYVCYWMYKQKIFVKI